MSTATRDTKIGTALPPTIKFIDQPMIDRYGKINGDSNTIHYDKEFAQECGFPDTIAHGLMTFGFISEMMTRFFGKGWIKGGKMEMSFIEPVHPGDSITTRGSIKERMAEGSGLRLIVEIWCENQEGKRVISGEASALVN